jgi:hypothetical protein
MFSLQIGRTAVGNMLYTADGKLLILNQDGGDTYISQYDYVTSILEYDVNVGAIALQSIFECNCFIYVSDDTGKYYIVDRMPPYALIEVSSISIIPQGAAQVNTCATTSLTTYTTTTSTTTLSLTTTTTTTI